VRVRQRLRQSDGSRHLHLRRLLGGRDGLHPVRETTAGNPCVCASSASGARVCAAEGSCGGATPCNNDAECGITSGAHGDVAPGFCHTGSCPPPAGFRGRCVPYCQ
jgi:hypothetical protein